MTVFISRTDLARNTRKAVERARRGGPVIIESYGEEQAAILDIVDYRLLRAVAAWQPDPSSPFSDPDAIPAGISADEIEKTIATAGDDPQALCNRVIHAYLNVNISLGRAANLLNLSRFELQDRLHRLDLPLRLGPRSLEEARREVEVLELGEDSGD